MTPQLFPIVANDKACKEHLGSNPVRFFPFGFADQNTPKPFAVWQVVSGSPLNPMTCPPDRDNYIVQVDVYSTEAKTALSAAAAIRRALERFCYVRHWREQKIDPETKDYRVSFDISFSQERW